MKTKQEPMSAGHALAHYRTDLEMTQDDLAEILRVSAPFVSMLEGGQRTPGRKLAVRIRELTGITEKSWDEV